MRGYIRDTFPDIDELKQNYLYDPESGLFRHKSSRGGHLKGSIAGTLSNRGYIIISLDGIRYAAHRLAWLYVFGYWPPDQVDHKNTVRSDNRIENLRLATQVQNNANAKIRSDNSTGHKGVSFDVGRQKFRAHIVIGGSQIYLGRYKDFETACQAYRSAATKMFVGFARMS